MPIVFAIVPDPVGAGFVESLARPGGNVTGLEFEYGMSGKWLELLKEIAPDVTRAAVLRDPAITAGTGQLAVIQSVAPSRGVESARSTCATPPRSSGRRRLRAPERRPDRDGGAAANVHRELILALAARHSCLRSIPLALRRQPAA